MPGACPFGHALPAGTRAAPTAEPYAEGACCARSLTTQPWEGDVLTVRFSITSLPGNPINITDLITISPSELTFTPTNYTFEAPLLVSCKRAQAPSEIMHPLDPRLSARVRPAIEIAHTVYALVAIPVACRCRPAPYSDPILLPCTWQVSRAAGVVCTLCPATWCDMRR